MVKLTVTLDIENQKQVNAMYKVLKALKDPEEQEESETTVKPDEKTETPKSFKEQFNEELSKKPKPGRKRKNKPRNEWNHAQDEIIKKFYGTLKAKEVTEILNEVGPTHTVDAVRYRARIKGMTKEKTKINKYNENIGVYKAPELEEKEDIKKLCPVCEDNYTFDDICEECNQAFGAIKQ